MTNKKEKILEAALELFANEGYNATPTSKIAKTAGVSEGLIFRHFGSKEGLLQAIVDEAERRVKDVFADILFETDPKKVIVKMLGFSQAISKDRKEADFWKLQYKIKWEIESYNDKKMEPVEQALSKAFEKLGYENADMEAKLFLVLLDGLATRFYLQKDFDWERMMEFLMKKYKL